MTDGTKLAEADFKTIKKEMDKVSRRIRCEERDCEELYLKAPVQESTL